MAKEKDLEIMDFKFINQKEDELMEMRQNLQKMIDKEYLKDKVSAIILTISVGMLVVSTVSLFMVFTIWKAIM